MTANTFIQRKLNRMMVRKAEGRRRYFFYAIIFLILQLVVLARNFYIGNPGFFFWMCDFVPIIFAIAFVARSTQMARGIINVVLIPQMIFLTGFILQVAFHFVGVELKLLEVFNYSTYFIIIALVFHFTSIVALFAVRGEPVKESSLIYSAVLIILTFWMTISLTPAESNINYINTFGKLGFSALNFLWIPLTFFIVAVPTYYFQRFLYSRENIAKEPSD